MRCIHNHFPKLHTAILGPFAAGIKKYDFHRGKDFPTPFREDAPWARPFPPNYYIDLTVSLLKSC